MNTHIVLSIIMGIAGVCALVFGLNHLSEYAWAWWRNRGTQNARDLWILSTSVVLGLALMYPAARLFSGRKQ